MSIRRPFLAASAIIAALGAPLMGTGASAKPLFETEAVTVRPDGLSGEAAVMDTLRAEGFGDLALGGLEEVSRHVSPTTNRTYLTYEQRYGGLEVYGSTVRATIEEDGTVSQVIHRIADVTDLRAILAGYPSANAGAISAAIGAAVGLPEPDLKTLTAERLTFEGGTLYDGDPVASRVLIADEDGTLGHAFFVESWSKRDNELVYTLVDTDGRVVTTEQRFANESYVAYKTSPAAGNPTVFGGWLADGTASPRGWLRSDVTQRDVHIRGENVAVYVDRDGNNAADGGGSVVSNGTFQTQPQLGQDAASWANQRAAVQSAFYHVNDMHDRLYKAGFTETAGNFQHDNHGRGGRSGDHVIVEVLDGAGTNNANIAVPRRDGTYLGAGPRMQLFKFTRSTPHRATSFDADIMWHEYGHGVIWRMVGDLDKPISWAVNEGFADALAIVATRDSRIGEWVSNRSAGIRTADYRGYKRTISSYRAGYGSRYANAEILAATMWRAKELLNVKGIGDAQVFDLMIDGLANTKPAPSFIDVRDGLLAAGRGDEDCAVWQAFAQFGMGEGATMSWSGSASRNAKPSVSVRASSRVPSSCGGTAKAPTPTPAPAPAPAPSGGDWSVCASENGVCSFSGTKTVRYGANGRYATKTLTGPVRCSNGVFGDPIPGTAKRCEVKGSGGTAKMTYCASENGVCSFTGTKTVRYGAAGRYVTKTLTGPVRCSNGVFGDPAPGVRKSCSVSTTQAAANEKWCSAEGGTCSFSGTKTVRYGGDGRYVTKTLRGPVSCSNGVFGDPAPGVGKACYVK